MATKNVELSETVYTKLDTGAGTATDCQNVGSSPVRVVFAAALPAVGVKAFFRLLPGQGISRDSKTDDMYALSELGEGGNVTVGE